MLRARRLASITAIAALGLSVLAGCRSDPSVAAYVDGNAITRERVDAIYDDAQAKLTKAVQDYQASQPQDPAVTPQPVEMPITRRDVATVLVGREVLRTLAEEKGVQVAEVAPEQVEQAIQLPRDTEYAKVYAAFQGYLQALIQGMQPRVLTDADLRGVYDRAQRGGGLPGLGDSYAEFAAGLNEESRDTLARAIALRELVYGQAKKVNPVVNPRYAPAELPLLQANNAAGKPVHLVVLAFSVSEDAPPVADIS